MYTNQLEYTLVAALTYSIGLEKIDVALHDYCR